MKLRSELVLNDIKRAIERHRDSLQAEEFRLSWFSIVCLLRAVGHVLDKVDSLQSPELKQIIDRKFKELKTSKPKPEIFWAFIEFERNRFLKEYEHGIDRGVTLGPIDAQDGKKVFITVDHGRAQNSYSTSPVSKGHSKIASGFFKGRNEKQVAEEALAWWTKYLDEIKDELKLTK